MKTKISTLFLSLLIAIVAVGSSSGCRLTGYAGHKTVMKVGDSWTFGGTNGVQRALEFRVMTVNDIAGTNNVVVIDNQNVTVLSE